MTILDINEIQAILPHRYPFLLVDRIVEMEAERIVGIKNVTANEPFFHRPFSGFPGDAGRADRRSHGAGGRRAGAEVASRTATTSWCCWWPSRTPASAARGARATAAHGNEGLKRKASVAKMAGVATVDGVVVAEAEVMCKLADKEEKPPAAGTA